MADPRTQVRNADHGPKVVAHDVYEAKTGQAHKLGTRLVLGDRVFRYCRAGGSALEPGYLMGAACSENTELSLGTAAALGARTVTVAITASANRFDDGYLFVSASTAAGNIYKIKSHTVSTSAAVVFTLYDPIREALTTSSDVMVTESPYRNVIKTPDQVILPIGIPITDCSAYYYCWLQTWGPCIALFEATAQGDAADERQLILSATAGAVTVNKITTTSGTAQNFSLPVVGQCLLDSVTNQASWFNPIFLQISP